ncbi:MAG TPA: BNR-4 repeat-containing protein [Gemmataceae bacterium]|nr:BNR-4 repeat-containing protein [Gemmataceae bacterium]
MKRRHALNLILAALALASAPMTVSAQEANYVAGKLIELNDNGAWSWFMDERAIVQDGKLIVGSIRAVGKFDSKTRDPNAGNVEVSVYDIAKGTSKKIVLHPGFEQDDHNNPAFLALPNKRILAMYSKHGQETKIYYRFSEPDNPLVWGEAHEFVTPGTSKGPFKADNATYNNLFRLSSGRVVNYFRGVGLDPNYMFSDDDGQTWKYGGRLLQGKGGYSPYMRYAFDGKDTIHFIATEDHPRNYANSVYHGFMRNGQLHFSDGKVLGPVSTTTDTPFSSWDLTKIFAGDADNVSWIDDVKLDDHGYPHILFSVKKDGKGLGKGKGGMDIRFHHGHWNGSAWETHEMAYAGTRLYSGEDDYTGLASFDRNQLNVVYLSTDADPVTGKPLISSADMRRHHEIFRGTTAEAGKTWRWQPITANSSMDNLRPIVPQWQDPRTALVWMRGSYQNNRGEWTTAVVATILPPISK